MNERVFGMLGLAARAGKLISGEKACLQTIRRGGAYAALIDAGASDNAFKALRNACGTHVCPLITLPQGRLGDAIGKPGRITVTVTDPGFAKEIARLAQEE